MLKKTLRILFLAVCLLGATGATAQMKTGRWTSYPVVGDMNKVVQTPDRAYFLLGPSLFSLGDDNEAYTYSPTNKLSDTSSITGIWYSADGKYLMVAYESGNIDILRDNGEVVNMADIKDAILSSGRRINDVAFADDRIYVATDFGLVVFDALKNQVIESGIYNQVVNKIFVMGERLVLVSKNSIYAAPLDIRHNQLDRFSHTTNIYFKDLAKLDDNRLVYIHTSDAAYIANLDFEGCSMKIAAINTGGEKVRDIAACADGVVLVHADNITVLSPDGTTEKASLPAAYSGGKVSVGTDLSSVWVGTPEGVARLNLSKDTPEVTMQPYHPQGISMSNPACMVWSQDGSRLYLTDKGTSFFVNGSVGDGFTTPAHMCYFDGGEIVNGMPASVKVDNSPDLDREQLKANTEALIGGASRPVVDPDDKSILYLPIRLAGIFAIKDGKVLNVFNSTNMPKEKNQPTSENFFLADIDQDGNLWVACGYETSPTIYVLPAAKRKAGLEKVQASDWRPFRLNVVYSPSRDYFVTFCKRSHYNFIAYGDWQKGLVVMDNNGTPSNFNDDKFILHTTFTDQNNNNITPDHITCATEDADGKVWVGTTMGIFVIDNPADAMSNNLTVRRPVVPRNDGTQLGDYLLTTEKVYSITIDHSNRKWITTESSGAYLVSADGTEIISNYNTSNSSLPSNCVISSASDPFSNKVYFGTTLGAVCLDSDSSPAADDYSEVYAYPNPVRPEYTGWITVAGLMDNSLVKIADAAGNVFFQGRSEGGMISWDGCDASGNRVRTGVYYVLASQNASGSASGAVAKILVVN